MTEQEKEAVLARLLEELHAEGLRYCRGVGGGGALPIHADVRDPLLWRLLEAWAYCQSDQDRQVIRHLLYQHARRISIEADARERDIMAQQYANFIQPHTHAEQTYVF